MRPKQRYRLCKVGSSLRIGQTQCIPSVGALVVLPVAGMGVVLGALV